MSDNTTAKKKAAAPREPQDHKPSKAAQAARDRTAMFSFTAGGVEYALPSPEQSAGKVSGRFVRDAVMGTDEAAQVRLAFATLEASDPDEGALDALYELPAQEMLTIVTEWFEASQGANPGES